MSFFRSEKYFSQGIFFPLCEKENKNWPIIIFKGILEWIKLFRKNSSTLPHPPANFESWICYYCSKVILFQAIFHSSTLIFVWHCFYWLVQCVFYSFQSNQTFATFWNRWCKLKLWPCSVNSCNFALIFLFYHRVFAVLQKECLSSMSCVFISMCFSKPCIQSCSSVCQN